MSHQTPVTCAHCGREMRPGGMPAHMRTHQGRERLWATPDEQDRMIELYISGLSMQAVADQSFWSATAVKRVLMVNGVTIRKRGHRYQQLSTDEQLRRCELYATRSLDEVAELCGRARSSVYATLQANGVKLHSRGWGGQRRAQRKEAA